MRLLVLSDSARPMPKPMAEQRRLRPRRLLRVYYLEDDSYDTAAYGFFSLMGGVLIQGIRGTKISAFDLGFLLPGFPGKCSKARPLREEPPVQVRIQVVEHQGYIRVGGRSPWRISAHWQNPCSAEIHISSSDNIRFDPSPHMSGDQVTVCIDPDNPKRHCMDTSFLPKLAE